MDIPLLALWFTCALGTATFAAAGPMTRPAVMMAIAAFAAGAWWIRQPFAPSPAGIALAAAVVAAVQVVRAPRRPYVTVAAGAFAGIWSGLLEFQGLTGWGSLVLAGLLPVVSGTLRMQRPQFAPPALREEALLLLVLLGAAAAALPGVTDGWRAAVNLSVQGTPPSDAGSSPLPAWTLTLATGALLSGALFSLWSRR